MSKKKNREGVKHVSSVPAIVELHRVAPYKTFNAGQYYIILKKGNGRKLYQSTDYYKRRGGALNSVLSAYGTAWKGDYRDFTQDGQTWGLFYHKTQSNYHG